MKVLIIKKYNPKDVHISSLLVDGKKVFPGNERADNLISTMSTYIADNEEHPVINKEMTSLAIVSNIKDFSGKNITEHDNAIIYDVLINGKSLFDIMYVHYVRFVGILNRNYIFKSMYAEINTVEFWHPEAAFVRELTHARYPNADEDMEPSMKMFSRLTHHQAIQLWRVTHGLEFYTVPYDYDEDTEMITLSAEDNIEVNFNSIKNAHQYSIYRLY